MNVSTGSLVQIGDLQYTSGGLLEVSGYVAGVGHSIGEWTAVGGTIALNATEVVAQPGAVFNISGGYVTYAAGHTPDTWLLASNGQLYNVNTAPANLTYTGIYDGFTVTQSRWGLSETFGSGLIAPASTYIGMYVVGRDAGTLTIDAPTTIMEATIAANVVTGEYQTSARPSAVGDPFMLAQSVVPLPGTLVIGPATMGDTTSSVPMTAISITENGQPLAASMDLATSISPDRVGTTDLAASLLNDAALGGLTVVTQGSIGVNAAVTLAGGGIVSLLAPMVEVSGALTARSGEVTIGNYSTTYFAGGASHYFQDTTSGAGMAVTLASGATIDTRGVFTNLRIDPATQAGEAFVNGGSVTIDTSGVVTLAAGSTIDASAGGAVLANGSAKAVQAAPFRSRRMTPAIRARLPRRCRSRSPPRCARSVRARCSARRARAGR